MKRILFILGVFLISFTSLYVNGQTIQSVTITSPILCNGDLADINILVNQTTPPTVLKVIVGYEIIPGVFISVTTTNNTTITNINVPGLSAQDYTIRLVDSLLYYPPDPFGNPANPGAIYDDTNINIIEPSLINIVENHQNATNPLTSDGSITLGISGGSSPYLFYWTGPNGFTSSAQDLFNIPAGIYWYTLTDSNGCVITDSVQITAMQSCSYGSFNSVNPICFGDANGKIQIDSIFGSPQFTYLLEMQDPSTLNWNVSNTIIITDTFYTFTNLFSGTYRYTLTDNSGCSITSPLINVQDPTPISSNNTIIDASSNINCNGQISSIINGGVAPISHFWTGPNGFTSSLPLISNLCAGIYCDSVVDAIGCNQILCDIVGVEPPCNPELEITHVFCDNDSSGMALVTKTNNDYPLFTWTNIMGDTLSMDTIVVNLPAGTYSFNAYNLGVAGACPDTSITFTILSTEINILSLNGDTICVGDSTSFLLEMLYADSSFTYQAQIGNDVFSELDTSLFYGSGNYVYSVQIDTGNGFVACFSNQNIGIVDNNLFIDTIHVVDEICATSMGSMSIFAGSSFPPFTYSIGSMYQSSSIFPNLSSAYYSVNVIDDMSCTVSQDSVFVDLTSLLSIEVDSALETCREDDGWIEVIASGGSGSYQYSIDSGMTFSSIINSDTLLIDSLSKGTYFLIVRDDSFCVYKYGDIYIGKTPRPNIDSVTTINESCCGQDGTISIYSSSYVTKYSIDTFLTYQNTSIFNFLTRGDYLVHIEDINDCQDSVEIYLEADSTPYINLTVGFTDVVCNGDSNGTFKVYYPDSCYSYELYRYTLFTPQISIGSGVYFNNLIPGLYGIIATSNSGTCIEYSSPKSIDEPNIISFDPATIIDVYCITQDSCNGEIFLPTLPTGGVSPYYYYLKDFVNNIPMGVLPIQDTFETLCPGEYEVQVVDGNACLVYDTVVVADLSLYIDSFVVQDVACYNGDDGVIEVFAHGGLGNYRYLWSNLDTTKIIDSLLKGQYFVTVEDSTRCIAFDSVFVSHPEELEFKILQDGKKPETCLGVTYDGEIYLEYFGGTPPYNFTWNSSSGLNSGSGFGDTIFNLSYDTIIIDVTDANFCNGSPTWATLDTAIVPALNTNNPLSFDSVYYPVNPICYGTNTGFIDIVLNGGDMPIQYSIDGANTFSVLDSFPHLNAGQYNIYVMDTYGCLDSAVIDIAEYDELVIHYDSIKHVSCYQGNDGYISVSNLGGVSPYTYYWIPTLDTLNIISHLHAIPHVIQVTDSVGCILVDTIDLHEMTELIQIQSEILSQVSCFDGHDGILRAEAIGGISPYQYWWINQNLDTVSNSSIADSLSSGTYTCIVSDSFNCGPISNTIMMTAYPELELEVVSITHNTCHGDEDGGFIFSINGGNPSYTTYILDENDNILHTANNVISGLLSSDYFIWSIDANECSSDTLSHVKLGQPGRIKINNTITDLTCFESEDGMMSISYISGNSPYDFIIEDNIGIVYQGFVHQTEDVLVGDLPQGEYVISVTDFNNCFVDSVFVVDQPDEIIADFIYQNQLSADETRFIAQNSSVGGQIFYWDFDNGYTATSSILEDVQIQFLDQGEYNVTLIAHDSILGHSCNDTIIKTLDVEGYDLYNVFSPNNDGINDIFHFNEWAMQEIYVQIFNRWGEMIYHWKDLNNGWDGRGYNGREAEAGVYFYKMESVGVDGVHFEEKGSVTLLR